MPEITMPRLSDTMQEGTLARWLKQPGEKVERGDVLAEIETDKATMELEVYDAGVLEKILVQEGETVPIGQAVAVVGGGEAASDGGDEATVGDAPAAGFSERKAPSATSPPPSAEETRRPPSAGAVKASPMARAIAREREIDLHTIKGSGPGGRIIRVDVEAAVSGDGRRAAPSDVAEQPAMGTGGDQAAASPPSSADQAATDEVEEIPLTGMRRAVARRLVESTQNAPHFYLTSVVDAEALVAFRADLNQRLAAAGEDVKLSLNDLLIKACATALRANPELNVAWAGDRILRHKRVHIGVAVAVEDGLIVPVVRDVDQKSLTQVSREAKALVKKARDRKLTPAEFSGGTFTISNLGMFGIEQFTAVINPPEAAILAVGATTAQPVARDGRVVVRQIMRLTLSIDHRPVDGATGARFLQYLKALIEEPLRIVA